ncbi:MAG: hypothetical protein ACYC27_01755 [Armatimonadota bacterium]
MTLDLMPIEHIPDWEMRLARQDAFWNCEIIDRPVVYMTLPKEKPDYPYPAAKTHSTIRERWMDGEYLAEWTAAGVMNTHYLGDALPLAWPNLGPEVFSGFFGCDMEYGDVTSWAIPNLTDWADVDKIKFSTDNFYWKKVMEMTDAFLHYGKGKFYTGITDLHPSGDALAAFRDPAQLCIDLIEYPNEVKKLLEYVTDTFIDVYNTFYEKIRSNNQAITCTLASVSTKKWYIGCNDFSYMISKKMFDDIFLPQQIREFRNYEACMYHLDGLGAMRHLDSLLELPEVTAIQFVPDDCQNPAKWIDVYKKIQDAGKGIQLFFVKAEEIDFFMDNLHPEGIWMWVTGVKDTDHADAILSQVSKWK